MSGSIYPLIFLYYNNKIKFMKTNYKKITLILSLLTIIFSVSYLLNLKLEKLVSLDQMQIQDNSISDKWVLYNDDKYNFSLDYPAGLDVKEEKVVVGESQDLLSYSLNFSLSDDGYNFMRVSIFKKTAYSSPDDWLKSENKNLSEKYSGDMLGVKQVIEKTIQIDGLDAIVTFAHSDDEVDEISKHERKVVFIKDGNLYVISTRSISDSDHEKVWNSFHFLSSF